MGDNTAEAYVMRINKECTDKVKEWKFKTDAFHAKFQEIKQREQAIQKEIAEAKHEMSILKREKGDVLDAIVLNTSIIDKKLAKQEIHYMCDNMDNWNWSSKSPFQNKYGKKRRFE